MKQLILLLTIVCLFSCNNSSDETNTQTKETPADENKNESPGSVKDKEDFMLTCNIDASNSLGGENQEKVKKFCECAWEKSKGEYRGEVIATESKLKKDNLLKSCFDAVQK